MHINSSTSEAIFRWKPACWLRVSGEDAASFLQGQFTNDLRALQAPGVPAVYGLWLSLKGKVLADSFVFRGAGAAEFWVGSYFSPAALIRERLESHVIADDVVLDDQTGDWEGVSCRGEETIRRAATAAGDGAFVFAGRRGEGATTEVVFRSGKTPVWVEAWAGPRLQPEDMERLRIAAGIPAIPADIGPADLPNEAGLDADAISYTKGCYLGQEVMARLKSMGQLRRRLVRVQGGAVAPPRVPAPLFAAGQPAGELRSAVGAAGGGWIGLALVSKLKVDGATVLALGTAGPGAVSLREAP